ncbi:MAG: hypothetical protein ACR2GY_05490 [Phycisphaerales bacterium]
MKPLISAWTNGRIFLSLTIWLAQQIARGQIMRILTITLSHLIGVIAGALAILSLFGYAKAMQDGSAFTLRGWAFPVDLHTMQPGTMVAGVAALGILSGLCIYVAEWWTTRLLIQMRVDFQAMILSAVSDPRTRGWPAFFDGHPRQLVNVLCSRRLRMILFAARSLLRLILPVILLIAALAVLIATDGTLALLLVPAVALYSIPLIWLNLQVARQQSRYDDQISTVVTSQRNAITTALDPELSREVRIAAIQALRDDQIMIQHDTLFWNRRLSDQRVQLLNTAFLFICLAAVFVYFREGVANGERSWADFLLAVIALQFCVTALRQVTARLILVSRFMPDLRELQCFLSITSQMQNATVDAAFNNRATFRLRGGMRQWNGSPHVDIKKGGMLLVLSPQSGQSPEMLMATAGRVLLRARTDQQSQPDNAAEHLAIRMRQVRINTTNDDCRSQSEESDARILVSYVLHSPAAAQALADDHIAMIVADTRAADTPAFATAIAECSGVAVLDGRTLLAVGNRAWLSEHIDDVRKWMSTHASRDAEVDSDDAAAGDLEVEG